VQNMRALCCSFLSTSGDEDSQLGSEAAAASDSVDETYDGVFNPKDMSLLDLDLDGPDTGADLMYSQLNHHYIHCEALTCYAHAHYP
jgi:hypothetical protein